MREYKEIKSVERVLSQLKCDRCKTIAPENTTEFWEFVQVNISGGYGSVLENGTGDGKDFEVDLCQHCVNDVLGPYMRCVLNRAEGGSC